MTRHPARYSDPILPILARMVSGCDHIHDPFAGTGRIFDLARYGFVGIITASELEPEWAAHHSQTEIADALAMPWPDNAFDAIVTSPTYGNRMADCFTPGEGWQVAATARNTYTHALGRKLHSHNSGQMQWGPGYRDFHLLAWAECRRVIRPGGLLVLNVSDHIRGGVVQSVTDWHCGALVGRGFVLAERVGVLTRRQRRGQNGDVRVGCEWVLKFELKKGE